MLEQKILLENAGAGEVSSEYLMPTNDVTFIWGGTFAGESLTLEVYLNSNWEPVEGGTFTAAGQKICGLGTGALVRFSVSSGAGAASINVGANPRY